MLINELLFNCSPTLAVLDSVSPALVVFLILLVVGMNTALWMLYRPGRYTPFERILYAPVYLLGRLLWRVEVYGLRDGQWIRDSVMLDELLGKGTPQASGAVVVANHRSSVDPFFVQLAAGARVHWMVAGEYFRVPGIGHLLRAYQAIPTNRGGVDTASTKRAMAIAKAGGMVGMFPEGRINRTQSDWMTVRPGAALIALRAGVPIVPIWIEGARMGSTVWSPLLMPTRVRIYIGEPNRWGLDPANRADEQSDRGLAEAWMQQVLSDCTKSLGRAEAPIRLAGAQWLNEETSTADGDSKQDSNQDSKQDNASSGE